MRARARGIPLVSIAGASPGPLDVSNIPPWLRRYYLYDADREWDNIISRLGGDERPSKVPMMAPPLPEGFIPRPSEMEQLIGLLLREPGEVALLGAGGTGKTVLAAAACHDSRVSEAFYDGILWTPLGPSPNLVNAITELYVALTSERPPCKRRRRGSSTSRSLDLSSLHPRHRRLWSEEALEPFLRAGPQCATLITTRNRDVARRARHVVSVEELSPYDAVEMLTAYFPEGTPDARMFLERLAERVGGLPLLLHMVGSALRDRLIRGTRSRGPFSM